MKLTRLGLVVILTFVLSIATAFARDEERGNRGGRKGTGQGKGRRMSSASSESSGGKVRGQRRRERQAQAPSASTRASSPSKKFTYKGKFDPASHTGGTLYVVDGGGGGTTSNLYVVDPADGSYTLVGSTGFSLTAIDVNPIDGMIYGVETKRGEPRLIRIDPAALPGTPIGPLNIPPHTSPDGSVRDNLTLPDITFDAAGTLYGWSKKAGAYDLFTVNLTTGQATKVADSQWHGGNGNGIAVAAGRMYLTPYSAGPLLTVSPATGQINEPMLRGAPGGGRRWVTNVTAMASNAAGLLYASMKVNFEWHLTTIDPVTGAVTVIGDLPDGIDGIDFNDTTGVLYAAESCFDTGDFYEINPATGAATLKGNTGECIAGLAVHPTTGVVYGFTNFYSSNPHALVTINPSNGSSTFVTSVTMPADEEPRDPGYAWRTNFTDIEFAPDGTLYGWGTSPDFDLYTINIETGDATKVGDSGLAGAYGGIAYTGGQMAAAVYGTAGSLLHLSTATGRPLETIVRNHPWPNAHYRGTIPATVASDDGTMFAIAKEDYGTAFHLMQLDPATGELTELGLLMDDAEGIAYTNALLVSAVGADVYGTKTASGNFQPGGTVIYTVVLTNQGEATQNDNPGPEFTDTLPAGLTLVDATASAGTTTEDPLTNTVTWNGSIAVDASVTITITATINEDTAGQTIANQGTIFYDANNDNINESQRLTDNPDNPTGIDDPTHIQIGPAAGIPTLNEFGLGALALMLAFAGFLLMRSRMA